eukprot:3552172-Prymnesium_polylepis.2
MVRGCLRRGTRRERPTAGAQLPPHERGASPHERLQCGGAYLKLLTATEEVPPPPADARRARAPRATGPPLALRRPSGRLRHAARALKGPSKAARLRCPLWRMIRRAPHASRSRPIAAASRPPPVPASRCSDLDARPTLTLDRPPSRACRPCHSSRWRGSRRRRRTRSCSGPTSAARPTRCAAAHACSPRPGPWAAWG